MLLDISEILDDPDFIQTVEFGIVTQSSTGTGDPLETEVRSSHDNTNVQPASGATLQRLPEGERTKDVLQVFTKSSFPIKNGDYMYYEGLKYRCITEENWSKHGYYDAIFIRYEGSQDITSEGFDPFA